MHLCWAEETCCLEMVLTLLTAWVNKAMILKSNDCRSTLFSSSGLPCGCADHFVPVCAGNGRTYPSACVARCVGFRDNQFVFGSCRSIDPCLPNPCPRNLRYVTLRSVEVWGWAAALALFCRRETVHRIWALFTSQLPLGLVFVQVSQCLCETRLTSLTADVLSESISVINLINMQLLNQKAVILTGLIW